MHGIFGAQFTIGNTSLHKLFSVSRDPYNIVRSGGLRILVESGRDWAHLAVPSAFEIGLNACRWVYCFSDRRIEVEACTHEDAPGVRWTITSDTPSRFLVFAHIVLGERELEAAGRIEIDLSARRFVFRPDPESPWGRHYPTASSILIAGPAHAVDAIGGDELLYADSKPHSGPFIAMRSTLTREFSFLVDGSLNSSRARSRTADAIVHSAHANGTQDSKPDYWRWIIRDMRLQGSGDVAAHGSILPWFAHDAMVHLTVPHGLEQYTGAAWGTRDVCQGPVEFLLALEHDEPVKEILRIVFAQQYETTGDWPQWFMLKPYSFIHEKRSHGDVIVWPLKALCDYLERTGDFAFLNEPITWRRVDSPEPTERKTSVAGHVAKLVATLEERFIPGTSLVRLGEGDWNDSLQPAEPHSGEWMVSGWTMALLIQQLVRYARLQKSAGSPRAAEDLQALASRMAQDLRRHLLRDGTLAGYALFDAARSSPQLLLHPADTRTGVRFSLLPMVQGIIGRLFSREEEQHHLAIIRDELTFPDGVRLMDRPLAYDGGIERLFRRAESAAFFGREIGLMYVHAHLRYCQALAIVRNADALWQALRRTNPILAGDIPLGRPRQRNTYFTSSDAAFCDRYEASARWADLRAGGVATEGGWRIYSSGPGLFVRLLVEDVLGLKRHLGKRVVEPLLPRSVGAVTVSAAWNYREERLTIKPE
jgi:cellobiose phosphorylase